MSKDDGSGGAADGPEKLVDHDRAGMLEKGPPDAAVDGQEKVFRTKSDAAVHFEQVDHNDGQLDHAGDDRCQRRTHDPHFRKTEFTEDQKVVEHQIDPQRCDRSHQRHVDDAHRPQKSDGGNGKGIGQIDGSAQAQIADAVSNDRFFGGENAHQHLREEGGAHRKEQRQTDGDPVSKTHDLADGQSIFFAPELGGDHPCAGGETVVDHHKQSAHLIGQRRSAHGDFTQLTQHNGVQHTNTGRDHTLDRHRQGDAHDRFVKGFVLYEQIHMLLLVLSHAASVEENVFPLILILRAAPKSRVFAKEKEPW